jgi:hypothetical protein
MEVIFTMMITGRRSLSCLMRIVIDLLLILNILALILLPWLLDVLYDNPTILAQLDRQSGQTGPDINLQSEYPADLPFSSYPFYLGFLYAAGCGTAWILLEGHLILRRLEKGQPFAKGQPGSFRRVAAAFALLAISFAVKIVFYNTLLTMFCCALFALFILIALILAEIFRQAYIVKTENELTI